MSSGSSTTKHAVEDVDSWEVHVERQSQKATSTTSSSRPNRIRQLKHHKKHHHHHHHRNHNAEEREDVDNDNNNDNNNNNSNNDNKDEDEDEAGGVPLEQQSDFWKKWEEAKASLKSEKEEDRLQALYSNPGIGRETTHGLLIDAGSTGSRLHVFEWEPRVLSTPEAVALAVSGDKLSFPGTESRWTQRLRPGLSEFSQITTTTTSDDNDNDQLLEAALRDYLRPLLEFAESVLAAKRASFGTFPIFLRATAGMRILDPPERTRVMNAVRTVLSDKSFNPFQFDRSEQARTLSGEEEAIYDWTGVNFLMGDLLQDSVGAGTVTNPNLTHGALDLGGGSTQIAFFSETDIMSNLFKLQIGQAKHWNVYAHSFLDYGMNEAMNRHGARLVADRSSVERAQGVYDPCMPAGSSRKFSSNIYLQDGQESWTAPRSASSSLSQQQQQVGGAAAAAATSHPLYAAAGGEPYHAILLNNNNKNDVDLCLQLAMDLLHLEKNTWCDFAHKGDCSYAGVYQPRLPKSADSNFGEFIAFSNYYHVWKFLNLPERATIGQLYDATRLSCAMDETTLLEHHTKKKSNNNTTKTEEEMNELNTYCFRSAYVFNLLHHGYGFEMTDSIRVSNVINGQKVGWALGAMLYEINALPWTLHPSLSSSNNNQQQVIVSIDDHAIHMSPMALIMSLISVVMLMAIGLVYLFQWRRHVSYQHQQQYYDPIKDVTTTSKTSNGNLKECQKLLQC